MSVHSGPNGFEDSLVFLYDAGNIKCYELRENLLPNSETLADFNLSRITTSSVATGGPNNNGYYICTVSATDGAQYLYEQVTNITAGVPVTQVWFVKDPDSLNTFSLRFWSGAGRAWSTSRQVNFTLSTLSSTINSGSVIKNTIENVGNGWYKLTLSAIPDVTGIGIMSFYRENSSLGQKFYVSSPQLFVGYGPQKYIPTTGTAVVRANTAFDLTNNNYDMTVIGNTVYSNGALVFDGNTFVRSTNTMVTNTSFISKTFTTIFKITGSRTDANQQGIFCHMDTTGDTNPQFDLFTDPGGSPLYARIISEYSNTSISTPNLFTSISSNTWYIATAVERRETGSNSTLSLFLNGNFIGSNTIPGDFYNEPADGIKIGGQKTISFTRRMIGEIAYASYHNRAFSNSEVQQVYQNLKGKFGL